MKVRCICGNLMHEENEISCEVHSTFLDEDYFRLLETNPKSVDELVDNMPLSGGFWKCKECDRLIFFKKGKLEFYTLEKEVLD